MPLQVLPAAAGGREACSFRFELRGLLPPWVVHRTLSALQDWHTGDLQVQQKGLSFPAIAYGMSLGVRRCKAFSDSPQNMSNVALAHSNTCSRVAMLGFLIT